MALHGLWAVGLDSLITAGGDFAVLEVIFKTKQAQNVWLLFCSENKG